MADTATIDLAHVADTATIDLAHAADTRPKDLAHADLLDLHQRERASEVQKRASEVSVNNPSVQKNSVQKHSVQESSDVMVHGKPAADTHLRRKHRKKMPQKKKHR